MLKLGIDDAGRGQVIGPMVLAGCLIDEKQKKNLKIRCNRFKKLTTKEEISW